MKPYYGDIAEDWKPTFENVAREFITEALPNILFGEKLPNFRFEFRETEAIDFIEEVLKDYTHEYDFYKEKSQRVLKIIKAKCEENATTPVMVVKDYKEFFELLRKFYERHIELYFLRTKNSSFYRYEKDNCFEQIWLRATPDDFNNAEEFLRRQVMMSNDRTFEKYDEETYLGLMHFLNNNVLCVKNGIARIWDENSREIQLKVYNRERYNNSKSCYKPHYTFPVIRYGIYERNGRKICRIGSIQNKNDTYYEENDLEKQVNRRKYKANEGVSEEDTYQVEPKNILALSIFISLLHKQGITEIEVPSLYVLDYEYHRKRNKTILSEFKKDWPEDLIEKYPEQYKRAYYYFQRSYGKEDLVSEIKTERLLLTFRRLLHHYTTASIKSYPGDSDSFMHLNIPVIKSEKEIEGNIFKEIYQLHEKTDFER